MSIVEQLKNNTSSGQISVLSKAISTECLCFFKNDSCFDNVKQWNLVFQNTPDYDNVDFGIDLLGGDQSINAAFMLNYNIKQSIEFLKKKSVSVKCLEADIHCSANLFLYKPDEMSTKKAYAFRSDLPLSGDVICSDSQEKDDYELPVMTWNVEKEENNTLVMSAVIKEHLMKYGTHIL